MPTTNTFDLFFTAADSADKTGTTLVSDKLLLELNPSYFTPHYFYLISGSNTWVSKESFTLRQMVFFCEQKGYNFNTAELGFSKNPIKGNINIAVDSISLSASSLTPTEGDSNKLTATVLPANATNKTVTWTSSAPTIVSVDASGNWNALKAGTATVTAKTNNNKTATTNFTVAAKPILVTGVTVDKPTLSVKVNETGKVTPTVAPSTATNKSVTWTSDKPTIVSVDNNGNYTAKAEGVAILTVKTTDQNKTATSTITVTPAE